MLLVWKNQIACIEVTVGDIEEPRIQTERPDTSTKTWFLRTQETNVETLATQFHQGLRRKVNKKSVKSMTKTNIALMTSKHWKV